MPVQSLICAKESSVMPVKSFSCAKESYIWIGQPSIFSFQFSKTHFRTVFPLRPHHQSCPYNQTYQRKCCTCFMFPTSMQYNSQISLVLIQSSKRSNTGADITQTLIMLLHSLRFIHSLYHDSPRHPESLIFSHNEQTCFTPA